MANEEHVAILKQGVDAWNAWREENPDVEPDLSYLVNDDFKGSAVWEEKKIETPARVNLYSCNLRHADLNEAHLEHANLRWAHLEHAKLVGAHLEHANLNYAHLEHANLRWAHLEHANLNEAHLEYADLFRAHLEHADLMDANCRDADLQYVQGGLARRLDEAPRFLRRRLIDLISLFGDRSIQFNESVIGGARFSPRSCDVWSVLRRNYTGPMLLFHLLLLIAFFTPYVAKTMWWVGVNQSQEIVESVNQKLQKGLQEHVNRIEGLEVPGAAQLAASLTQLADEAADLGPCLREECEQLAVWQLLLGVKQPSKFGRVPYWMLATMLLTYNVGRGFLTWKMAPFRDEEERSGHSPNWNNYGWLIWVHRFVTVVVVLAFASFIINAWNWLNLPVWIPALS